MSLEKASITWSAKQLKSMVMNGKIDFNHIVQRSFVWERKRKCALIESMILGYPIPPVFAKRDTSNDKRYIVLDGKQRLSTVKEYLNDEFALTVFPPVTYIDDETNEEHEVDISGLKFSELPIALQDHLNTVPFGVTYFDNLTKAEEVEMFRRLNSGKPLSTKSRMLASCKDIEELIDIGSHTLFEEMLTDKARENKNQVSIIAKCWCMLNQEIVNISFESKELNPLLESLKITDAEKVKLINVFNVIVNVHTILIEKDKKKVAKKLYTETHMVSLVPYIQKAIESGIDDSMIADWLIEFFDVKKVASISDDYNAACTCGSARNANILARNEVLSESYVEFFTADSGIEVEDIDDEEDDAETICQLEDSLDDNDGNYNGEINEDTTTN